MHIYYENSEQHFGDQSLKKFLRNPFMQVLEFDAIRTTEEINFNQNGKRLTYLQYVAALTATAQWVDKFKILRATDHAAHQEMYIYMILMNRKMFFLMLKKYLMIMMILIHTALIIVMILILLYLKYPKHHQIQKHAFLHKHGMVYQVKGNVHGIILMIRIRLV